MHLRHTWPLRIGYLVAAAVAIWLVIGAGNMLGQVLGEVIALSSNPSSATHGYDYYGAVAAGALLVGIWAGIVGFRFLSSALLPMDYVEPVPLQPGPGR